MKKETFLKSGAETLSKMYDFVQNQPVLNLKDFDPATTAVVIVDMTEGFTRTGALASPRVANLIPKTVEFIKKCKELGISMVAFADTHTKFSPEFKSYPIHGLKDTIECEIVKEIKEIGGYTLIPKNTTNGMMEVDFTQWLIKNHNVKTIIVIGCCTDICVLQFALSLKTLYNVDDNEITIIVPTDMVETYDYDLHNGDMLNVVSLYMMSGSGITLAKDII